jgi:CBS domain-containing protein
VPAGEVSLFLDRVQDFVTRPALVCAPDTGVAEVARLLSRHRVGSVVVTAADGSTLGIVTDRDLRRKVVAEGRDAESTRAADVMSAPVIGIRPGAFAFEAVLEMTRREIRHLAVIEDGRLVGVVSLHDFLVWQTLHPVMLAREIARAPSLDSLAALGARVADLAGRLVAEGGGAHDIGRLVSELNDRVVARVLDLVAGSLTDSGDADPPTAYCWLSFGSEARREQTLRTDQDNGLVFADVPPEVQEGAARWCRRLAEETVSGLVRVGVPPCPGGIMASNPRWCQPLSVWRDYFRRWISDPTPDQVLGASVHFDLRPLAGASELGHALSEVVREEVPRHRGFLQLLAADVVERRVPLTLLGRIATPRTGPHRGAIDLKGAGAMQLVGAGRVHALELGLSDTNTLDRFRAAQDRGLYSPEDCREIVDAAQHLMRLRLVHQFAQRARGEALDNVVAPAQLTHSDRILLREALRTVARVQAGLRERFATDFAPR